MKKLLNKTNLIVVIAALLLQTIGLSAKGQWATTPIPEQKTPTITYVLLGASAVCLIVGVAILISKHHKKNHADANNMIINKTYMTVKNQKNIYTNAMYSKINACKENNKFKTVNFTSTLTLKKQNLKYMLTEIQY